MQQPTKEEVREFLYQSNLIEGIDNDFLLKDAIRAWNYLIKQDVLTVEVILNTHRKLMKHSDLAKDEIGNFRTINVWVGSHQGANPASVPLLMKEQFCFETMRPNPNWQDLHVFYEVVHPFVDGNGRTGRMFMNWTRLKRCKLPLLTILASERQDYYQWFK